jgi:hypothetical protein
VEEFSRDNYSSIYTEFRNMILNSEAMPKLITEWAKSVLESRERAKEREKYWSSAYYNLYAWVNEYFITYDLRNAKLKVPPLPKDSYGKPFTDELLKEVEEKVAEWKNLFPDKERV